MPVELTIALTALLVENEHLISLDKRSDDFANDLRTCYGRSANGDGTILVDEEYLVKFDYCATLYTLDVVDEQAAALLYIELLPLDFCNNVHCVSITTKKLAS